MGAYIGNTEVGQMFLGSTEIGQAYLGSTKVWEKGGVQLPYDAEIEYLQTDGNAYINTLLASGNDAMEFKFRVTSFSSYGAIFGNYVAEASNVYRLILTNANNGTYYANAGNKAGNALTVTSININRDHVVSMNRTAITVDGRSLSFANTQGAQNTTNYALFARNINGERINSGTRIYYFKITQGDTLVRDFIPVRVGQVGYMYDKVSGQLFANAGSGNFIIGNDKTT